VSIKLLYRSKFASNYLGVLHFGFSVSVWFGGRSVSCTGFAINRLRVRTNVGLPSGVNAGGLGLAP